MSVRPFRELTPRDYDPHARGFSRSVRYAAINSILYASGDNERMNAAEVDRFELWCPDWDMLRDDGVQQEAVREWRIARRAEDTRLYEEKKEQDMWEVD